MINTDVNFDIHRPYSVYICSRQGSESGSYSCESGQYTAHGVDYLDAAQRFALGWNRKTGLKTFGNTWKKIDSQRKGMPSNHCYVQDDQGKTLLLIPK